MSLLKGCGVDTSSINSVSEVTKTMAAKVEETAKDMGAAVEETAKDMGAAAGGVLDGAVETVGNAAEGVGAAVGTVVDGVEETASAISNFSLPSGQTIQYEPGSFTARFIDYINSDADIDTGSSFAFDKVNFETGSARLTAESAGQVNNLAEVLKAYPSVTIKVEGHTDNTGNAEANKSLSAQRALSVKSALAAQNVQVGRVKAEGFGQTSPVADNATEEGRAANRRVSVRITGR